MRHLVLLALALTAGVDAQTSPESLVAEWPALTAGERARAMRAVFSGDAVQPTFAEAPERYVGLLDLALREPGGPTQPTALTLLAFGGVGIGRGLIEAGTFDPLAPLVLRAASARAAPTREAAYGALLAFDDDRARAALVRGTRDPDAAAAGAALAAVYVLGTTVRDAALPPVLGVLRTSLARDGEALAGAAVTALGALFRDADRLPPEVERALGDALRDGRPYVQQEALRAVADVGAGAAALRPLVAAIADRPPPGAVYLGPNARATLRRLDGARSTRDPVLR